jgi:type VI secretion system protein ImpK
MAFQEAFTVAVRLRANRQVAASADAFRDQVKALLAGADREARQLGYSGEDVRMAVYAYIAFLDETVLNSSQPMFEGWSRRPLQEEVFGDHVAGETFFRNLSELMARQDSEDLADVLEVYLTCLLLGFKGRYAAQPDAAAQVVAGLRERLHRIRGGVPEFGPDWDLPRGEAPPNARDPWVLRLSVAAGVALLLAGILFVLFQLSLGASISELRELTGGMVSA